MKVTPLAFDSMGVRSMATLVETRDIRLLIDPGVALAKNRDGFGPHPIELREKEKRWRKVKKMAGTCDALVVTHYHYDHHDPEVPEIYEGKRVFIKSPKKNINFSQKERAELFIKKIKPVARRIEVVDGESFAYGGTRIEFSCALPHGIDTMLGYVIMVLIDEKGERFLHTSDVQGPSLPEQEKAILELKPDVLVCDGPMTHMLGEQYPEAALEASERNLIEIVEKCKLKTLVLDHHFLRDLQWRERMPDLMSRCEELGTELMTAAELAGEGNNLLEANRMGLYKKNPIKGGDGL